MADPATPIRFTFQPGMFPDTPPADAEGFWRLGSGVRWRAEGGGKNPSFETLPGYERASLDLFDGTARAALAYADNSGYPFIAIGTNTSLWELFDGELYNATPVASRGMLSAPFSTTALSTSVVVTHTAHGRAAGDFASYSRAVAVGGITLDGIYNIISADTNFYVITSSAQATGTATGGGYVDYDYHLAGGLEFSLAGAGYGAGAYNVGLYGGSSTSGYIARLWSLRERGQDLIAAVRDGGIYFLAPYVTTTDLAERVQNGDFTTTQYWSFISTGSSLPGWQVTAGYALATSANGRLREMLTLLPGGYALLKFTITNYLGGSVVPIVDSITAEAPVSALGRNFAVFWTGNGGGQNLDFLGVNFTGQIDDVSIKMLGTGHQLGTTHVGTEAPSRVSYAFVSQYGHIIALGTADAAGNFDPMQIRCSDPDDVEDWTQTVTNEARTFSVSGGTRLIAGHDAPSELLAISDTSLFAGTYVAPNSAIFRWRKVGTNCGLNGQNASTVANGRLYWMGNNRQFYVYAGGEPQVIPCPGTQHVFDHIAQSQQDLIQCHYNAPGNEIWWSWPDSRDGNEVSRNVRYTLPNTLTGQGGWWQFDDAPPERTAWAAAHKLSYPIGCGGNNYVYYHEKGVSGDGSNITFRLRSGAIDIAEGETLMEVQGYSPDIRDQQGSFSLTVYGYEFNDRSVAESATVSVMTNTEFADFFVQGRQIEIEYSGDSSLLFAKVASGRFWIQNTGNMA